MSKRHLDLRGSKAPKLELDFLRLLFVVRELRRSGDQAVGYLAVATSEIKQRSAAWAATYGVTDEVHVVVVELSARERKDLEREARANRDGMIDGAQGKPVRGRSNARTGGGLLETKLAAFIRKRERAGHQVRDQSKFPYGIQWDYYGTIALG